MLCKEQLVLVEEAKMYNNPVKYVGLYNDIFFFSGIAKIIMLKRDMGVG